MRKIVLLKTAYTNQYLYIFITPLNLENNIRTKTLGLQLLQTKGIHGQGS